jgi:hypothetical protein
MTFPVLHCLRDRAHIFNLNTRTPHSVSENVSRRNHKFCFMVCQRARPLGTVYSSSTFHDVLNAGKRTLEHVYFPVPTTVVSQYMLAESLIESRSKLQIWSVSSNCLACNIDRRESANRVFKRLFGFCEDQKWR